MKKLIKKYGNTHVIVLDKEDLTVYDIKEGDVLDIEFVKNNTAQSFIDVAEQE